MFKIATALTASVMGLFIAGCATTTSRFVTPDEVSDYLVTKTPAQMQSTLGSPRTVEHTGPNTSVWTYHSDMIQDKKATQGKCEMIITFEGDKAVKALVNATEYSPFAAPLATCNLMLNGL
ncbi:hypothetical protein ADIMK_3935 [Marinobacterium lacunae]|uniref:Outer membrane protein assembly factor BamE domain-containing protein n=1 Tax=Marinobacterium lacunae TaxID=1232683 RepID=A0A081FTD3_9GAMM|nr:outer membrane protein assembly factor BamE [Marinobacterium lacunae]KEA61788.1 hypothetical protein ADIMK_3935 [Marinobacterium lacunae]MBR9884555.1 outer membrane protein assembly factor BamE [Oceanospirillales bacterium]